VAELLDQLGAHRGGAEHALVDDDEEFIEKPVAPTLTEEDFKQEGAAPGQAAQLPLGVVYQGDWTQEADGMARHVRESALALATHLPVRLKDIQQQAFLDEDISPSVLQQVGYLRNTSFAETAVAVRHIIIDSAGYLRAIVSPHALGLLGEGAREKVYESTVVHTSLERDRVGGDVARELGKTKMVWVPCEANARALLDSGLHRKKVAVVPYPYDPATHPPTQIAAPRGRDEAPSGLRFYNIGKWEPRKGQHALIGAFLLAFGPKERACLTIKTHGWGKWKNYPTPQESIETWANDPAVVAKGWTRAHIERLVRVVSERLTDEQIVELHRRNNVYVSAGHGEAWDIPAFDARCAGNSLVYVGYGGPEDYTVADDEHFVQVQHQMGPVDPGYNWEPSAQWATYEVEDLATAMSMVQPPERRYHPAEFAKRYARHAVGALMRRLLLNLMPSQEAWNSLESVGCYG
jgi:glycosyltransferase involved in cell wall biosynthesis